MPGAPGNIVDGVAAEGHHVDDALGRDTEDFLDLGGIADQIIFRWIQDLNIVVYELHHVFVAGDHVDAIGSPRQPCERECR